MEKPPLRIEQLMSQQFDKRIQSPINWSGRAADTQEESYLNLKMCGNSSQGSSPSIPSPDKFFLPNVKSELGDIGENQAQTGQVIQVTSGKLLDLDNYTFYNLMSFYSVYSQCEYNHLPLNNCMFESVDV
jgi:hypothetical protein